ncbi:unnamed protein product [Schistocephalus solidus]|uniref:Uncharacterized protein n=1 Tax=Schistocephalus solidus TaxID=70667 RepID=A0A3P7EY42_SCHSO|nr:unnamed protein product [Schistocephalus solidus]
MKDWMDEIKQSRAKSFLLILASLKMGRAARLVQTGAGRNFAMKAKYHYTEAFAKNGIGVDKIFITAASSVTNTLDAVVGIVTCFVLESTVLSVSSSGLERVALNH